MDIYTPYSEYISLSKTLKKCYFDLDTFACKHISEYDPLYSSVCNICSIITCFLDSLKRSYEANQTIKSHIKRYINEKKSKIK